MARAARKGDCKSRVGYVESIRAAVLKESDGLVFPTLRREVVNDLATKVPFRQAEALEREAHVFATGSMRWYVPVVQHLIATAKRDTHDAVARYVELSNAPLPTIPDPVTDCVREIEAMRFKCTVPGCDEGGRRCPKRGCGSNDLEGVGRQTRSMDEGQTVFFKCRKCGEEFR